MYTCNFIRILALLIALFLSGPATALDPTEGEVLLTVTGEIESTNEGDVAQFDLALLEGLAPVEIETTTIWTEGVQTFLGVELVDLLAVVGASGDNLRAVALNDYAAEIPVSDAVAGGPIVAFLRNGEEMGVRDKGPLWLIYPYDREPEYRSELIYSRSVWQLIRIEVLP